MCPRTLAYWYLRPLAWIYGVSPDALWALLHSDLSYDA